MGAAAKFSLCMIVRDEERLLARCLASVRGVCEDLVVVDTGSRDGTLDVARSADARVSELPWTDDFAAARNAALSRVRTPWALVLDADEELATPPDEARRTLASFAAAHPGHVGRLWLRNEVEGAQGASELRLSRLLPADGSHRFEGAVHEQIVRVDGAPARRSDLDLRVRHDGYAPGAIAARGKLERNLGLLRRALERDPKNGYLSYQLGRTLALAGRPEEALAALERALENCPDAAPWGVPCVETGAYALRALERSAQARALVAEILPANAARPDTVFLAALLALDAGDLAAAESGFRRCLELPAPTDGRETVAAARGSGPAFNLGAMAEVLGRPAEARGWYRRALELEPGHGPSRDGLARLDS